MDFGYRGIDAKFVMNSTKVKHKESFMRFHKSYEMENSFWRLLERVPSARIHIYVLILPFPRGDKFEGMI